LSQANTKITWEAQPGPQRLLLQCPAFECMYGGAVGGGKSDGLLGDFAQDIENEGPAWQGVYFRRFFPDMEDIIGRSMEIFGPVYGEKCFSVSRSQWNFPNGAKLRFRAIEKDKDVYKFQGQQYSWIGWDELTQWPTPFPYTYLMTRLRSAKGARVRVRAATNPGGVGHSWVKSRFVDPSPPGQGFQVETKSGDRYWRVFIPSKLEDNQILMQADPGYADRIYELSDPLLADALRKGRWDIIAGAAIPEWDPDVHIIDPAPIPSDKPVFRCMDWGYVEPYAAGWYFPDNDGRLIMGQELYGWGGQPNVGSKEAPSEVRRKIETFESMNDIWVPYGLLDGQCWEERGQTGRLVEELGGRELGWRKWPKGPNSRVNQKQAVHNLLSVTNGRARFAVMRHCHHFIRTIPMLERDKNNIEDVDTNCEDHHWDQFRAAATKKIPNREQLKQRALRQFQGEKYITADQLPGGGF